MIIVRRNQASEYVAGSTTIDEYVMDEDAVSGAVAHVSGRYPEEGFARNDISREIVYVTEGAGRIIQPDRMTEFSAGDVIFIGIGESFAWEGYFTIFMVTAPKFDPTQHKIT